MDLSKSIRPSNCFKKMILLEGNGITLKQLNTETIQLVRIWRNQPEIRSQMEFQEEISESAQLIWFQNLNQRLHQYFVIHIEDKPIGLIHLKNIDFKEGNGEAGLFIGEKAFRGTGASLGASLLLLDYAFNKLNLRTIQAKVKNDNSIAQQYNQLLGFKKKDKINDNFFIWELSKSEFEIVRTSLVKLVNL